MAFSVAGFLTMIIPPPQRFVFIPPPAGLKFSMTEFLMLPGT